MVKKLLIAGYPRSGNTWLGYLLSYILNAKYEEFNAPKNSKPTLQKEVLKLIEGKLSHRSRYNSVVKTHERYSFNADKVNLESFDKTILIVRDPRDVAVSLYYYTYSNLPIALAKPENLISKKFWFIKKYLWRKIVYKVAREWPLHTASWRTYEGTKLVKYEYLYQNPTKTLRQICQFLEYSPQSGLLKKALQLFTFKQLSGGRKKGEEYQSGFFRKGVIGDYKNHFDWLDKIIMKHYAYQEMKELNYT